MASLNPNLSEQELLSSLSSDTINLKDSSFGMPPDMLSESVGQAEKQAIIDTLTPTPKKPDDSQKIDEQVANISINLKKKKLFLGNLSDLEDDDAESDTDPLKGVTKTSSIYNVEALKNTFDPNRKAGFEDSQFKDLDISGKTEEEVQEELERDDQPFTSLTPPDLTTLYDPIKQYATDAYGDVREYFSELFEPKGLDTEGVYSVSSGTYTQAIPTGLGTRTSQSAIGLSQPPPASLAGAQTGDITNITGLATSGASAFANIGLSVPAGTITGLGTKATVGAAGAPSFQTGLSTGTTSATGSALKLAGQAASLYGIYAGVKEKDYFSAGLSLITLINPATAIPAAILQGAKMLFGAWSASKRSKPKFGGAEFKAEKNRLMATEGYGYNGYQPSAGKATVASIADYVNTYVKTFGLQFNGSRWAKAIKADPRLNRYDNTNESGYADRSLLTRKIFETEGLITGTPTYNGQPITSQEDYKEKVKQFNEYYQKTALERGGLVDAAAVGIDPATLSNEYNKITFKVSNQVGGGGTGRQYVQRTTGGRGGGGTTQTGYWQTTGTGGRGGGNRVWVPAAPNVVVQSGGRNTGASAYAISYRYEDATPFDMLYKNLVGNFNRGQGGTYY